MMKKVIIKETYKYEVDVDATTNKEAINKVKEMYDNPFECYNGYYYDFTATANTHDKTTFKVKN